MNKCAELQINKTGEKNKIKRDRACIIERKQTNKHTHKHTKLSESNEQFLG
jgi:hypothetical protein